MTAEMLRYLPFHQKFTKEWNVDFIFNTHF